ncbi:MAG: fibronectin type III domain-containing protein [Candidatus Micrarchaeota archaeon]
MIELNRFAVAAFAFVALTIVFAGCVQEKQWPASPTPFVASVTPNATASLTPTPTATRTPTPTATQTPTPSPSPLPSPSVAAPSCILTASPNSFVGPITDVVLAAAFKNLPSSATTATLKCFSSDSGQSVVVGSQGGAFRSCAYPLAPIGGTTYEASASAGGASCTAALMNGYNASAAPIISSVVATAGANNATITWTTDVASDGRVEYGLNASYGSNSTLNSSLLTSHVVVLTGLTASTTFYYRVWSCKSLNAYCASATSSTGIFSTTAPSPTPTPTPVYSFNASPPTFTATLNSSNVWNASQTITLSNTGNQALSVTSCASDNTTLVTVSNCPSTIAVNSTAAASLIIANSSNVTGIFQVIVTFQATSATAQTSTGSITVN